MEKLSPEFNEKLRQLYPHHDNGELSQMTGLSTRRLLHWAMKNGIRKSPETMRRIRERTCFQKGRAPFNKGRAASDWMSAEGIEKCSRTRFQQKHIPHNARPQWSERIDSKEGYVYIKPPGYRRFTLKHRYIWEQHYGKIPAGCQIHFRDGDKTNCDISNLEMMTCQENARRNSFWNNLPYEVARLVQLKGALNRQINKHNKSNQK